MTTSTTPQVSGDEDLCMVALDDDSTLAPQYTGHSVDMTPIDVHLHKPTNLRSGHLYKSEYRKQIEFNSTWCPPTRSRAQGHPPSSHPHAQTPSSSASHNITSLTRRDDLYMLDDSQSSWCDVIITSDDDDIVAAAASDIEHQPPAACAAAKLPQPRLHRRKQATPPPYVRYVANKKNETLARQLPLMEDGPRTDLSLIHISEPTRPY